MTVTAASKTTKQQKITKEEELLLQDFSRNVTFKSSIFFYVNALIVSTIPLWLFWKIHQMEPLEFGILWVIMTLVSTWLVSFAYRNSKFVLKHKFAQKREDAVAREVLKSIPDDKKMPKKEKDERILWKKNEVAEFESTSFAIFYNNTLYIFLIILFSFYLLRSFNPNFNYILSVASSSGLLALLSTGSR